jgi:membrane protease YdiL (CAAX protease family)
MQKYLKISKYHVGMIVVYLLIAPFLWKVSPQVFRYGFNNQNTGEVMALIGISILGFGIYLHFFKKPELKISLGRMLSKIPLLLLYALFFAGVEEIIFRGIIQSYFYILLSSSTFAVLAASLVFGAIHLPNGATGIAPGKWNWQFAGIAFLGGLVLGEIFVLTDSLLFSTLLHVFFSFVLLFKATRHRSA